MKDQGIGDPAVAISSGLQFKLTSLRNKTAVNASGVDAQANVAGEVADVDNQLLPDGLGTSPGAAIQ